MTDIVTILYIKNQVMKFDDPISAIVSTDAVWDGAYEEGKGKTARVSCS